MNQQSLLAEKEFEIESLKNHIEALLDEQENLQKQQEGNCPSCTVLSKCLVSYDNYKMCCLICKLDRKSVV